MSGKQISQEAVTIGPFLQPVIFWSLGGTPILMAALAFNRFVRGTVGPMFLTAALSVLLSSFVTFDLLVVAGPSRPLVGRLNRELGTPSTLAVVWSLSLFAACIAAWLGLRWVVRRYRRQQMSDQMFLLDALWLSLSAFVCVLLMYEQKPFRYLLGLLPFVLYKAAVGYGLSSLWKRASQMPGARLLFLRVFGSSGRAEKLFDLLAARWRYAGTIQLISGTDVARGRFEPDEFFDFVSGKLGDAFITSEADLEKRLASLNTRPDPDGRFRVNEFFCRADTWQLTVTRLMTVSDVLIMDLRAFTPERRGCVFELGAILDTVPLSRAVLLVDRTTDQPALRATLTSLWKRVKPHSPNVRGSARVRIVDLAGGYPAAVRYLMRLGDELALAAT